MNATLILPNVTLAEPPTRHVTDHVFYAPTSAYSLATYSASEPATPSLDRHAIEQHAEHSAGVGQ